MINIEGEVALKTDLFGDPQALFERLGRPGPVHRVALPDGMPAWLVTGHAEVREVLSDPRLVRGADAAAPELRQYLGMYSDDFVLTRHMMLSDPPDHTRMRRAVSKAFTPRRVEQLRPRVEKITRELVDAMLPQGTADIVDALALPLPIAVICEMLGVPFEDRAEFGQRAEVITGMNASSGPQELVGAGRWFDAYLSSLVERRRTDPGDDMISGMLQAQIGQDPLSDLELRSNAFILLVGGFETSVNLIANGLLALLRHPEALSRLRDDLSLLPEAVEEMMRLDSPVSTVTYRFATEKLTIGGVEIQPGDHVAVSIAAANHDPTRFPDPSRLDITRKTNGHLSFSHGIHFCLGAPLARLEGEIAFRELLSRTDGLRLAVAEEELRWKQNFIVHRLEHLPVTFASAEEA
ncbi:cytochrome P450 [Streptomyces sp. NPDC060053]|uniref:cytochrome P450 family protein n=1 Tax=Streptomyces sp. NPDC060053 TaxID=3347047 RepID=UPI0036849922